MQSSRIVLATLPTSSSFKNTTRRLFMATVICMDGLGGCPEVTFGELKLALEKSPHHHTCL